MEEKRKKRCGELVALSMLFDGQNYIGSKYFNRDFNVHFTEIACDPDDVWDAKISKMKKELDRRESANRPIVNHKHTKGDWERFTISTHNGSYEKVQIENGTSICNVTTRNWEQAVANAKLISIAPQLLQIAEMFFDTMKDTEAEGSLAFTLTLETLKKLHG